MKPTPALAVAGVLIATLGACSTSDPSHTGAGAGATPTGSSADCEQAVRYDGEVYVTGHTLTDADLNERVGEGVASICEDSGPEARGAVFTGSNPTVQIWSVNPSDGSANFAMVKPDGDGTYVVELSVTD